MNCALIVEITIVILKVRFSSCGLRDLGEVVNKNDSVHSKDGTCMVRPSLGAVLVQDNSTTQFKIKGGLGIVGGERATNLDFPHSVIFINFGGVCAGSIVSDKLVLTAAHCFDYNKMKKEMVVYAGARFLFDRRSDVHKVQEFVIHERYNNPIRFANDVALLKIQDKFRFRDVVKSAELVENIKWMVKGAEVTVAGWGEDAPGTGKVSQEFKSVNLKLLSQKECVKKAGTSLSPDMLCLWGGGKGGSCLGDSGGGAFWNKKIVGIVSHGGTCGSFPGVYTNVASVRRWIIQASNKLKAMIK